MKTLVTLLSGASLIIGLAALPNTADGQDRQRKRDGSCGDCPRVDCPNPDCPQGGQQAQAGQQQRKRDGSVSGSPTQDRKRDRKRDGSCASSG